MPVYQRLSAVLFPVVTLFFIGALLWGYQEHQEKNAILVKAENQYQRAFHDLTYHMDQLHEELGNTLAVSSTSNFHRKGLVNMWRLTSQAQSEVNQLPLTLMPFNETEELLANIASFSYKTATRDLQKQPLKPAEMKVLHTLYERSKEIAGDLREVQGAILTDHLQWMDVETALASGKETFDNDIIDGMKLMNDRVSEYGDIDWGPTAATMNRQLSMQMLDGPMITEDYAKELAAQFLGTKDTSGMKVVENGADTDFVTYSVSLSRKDKNPLQLEFTKKGGRLVYFIKERNVAEAKLGIPEAVQAAQKFLKEHDYGDMEPVTFDQYTGVASIQFAHVVEGVTVYPEKLAVKVALDNGEVNGLSAGELLYTAGKRVRNYKPTLTESEAKQYLNPNFRLADTSLAIIRNEMNEEVLCYEFIGRINGGQYRIYINAEAGMEEKIERIRDADAKVEKEASK